MALSFSFISHAVGALAFALLAIYILSRYLRRVTDKSLFLAATATAIWMSVLAIQSLYHDIPFYVRYTIELLRNAAWFGVMFTLLGIYRVPSPTKDSPRFVTSTGILLFVSFLLAITLAEGLTGNDYVSGSTMLILQVAVSLIGLLLLEQTWRNAHTYSRSGIKYLTIAIASLFGYDFFMYSDALLFQQLSTPLWDTRGAVNALAAPFIALTMINSRQQPIGMHVSRQMVFHTTTFIIAGIYLLVISAGGYYISLFGGTWGEALRVLFIFAGLLVLVVLVSSPVIRARIMVFISKNFFDYKYDYRDEWIKSTNALRGINENSPLPVQTIRVLGELVGCHHGAIWTVNEDGHFGPIGKLGEGINKLDKIDAGADVCQFFASTDWIINLHEYMLDPTTYNLIEIPECMLEQEDPWLIIPLRMNNRLTGMVLLCRPIADQDL
ncbi:MAG: PEP-CTERM system histidine kinase PrsK, partial [Oleiphilaceae bacterium]|nr:PEP-CTERM system histidine kinase PrsK [Oleiphilaceae bacterium]